jgi:hypothetical protein
MPFVREFYDPETLQLMTRALKEALRESHGPRVTPRQTRACA